MPSAPRHYVLDSAAATDAVFAALEGRFRTVRERGLSTGETYYDTFDWRLHHGGFALADTTSAGGTRLLVVYGRDGSERIRWPASEIPAFAADLPEGPLRDLVAPLAGIRRLLPVVRLSARVETLHLLAPTGAGAARIDGVNASSSGPGHASEAHPLPARLVLWPQAAWDDVGADLVAWLEGELGLEADARTVFDDALDAIGRRAGDYSNRVSVELDPGTPAAVAMRRVLARLRDAMAANLPGVREALDTEFLHDFRVAVRRTRSALGLAEGVFEPDEIERFRAEFEWLGEVTGPTRDLDVYRLRMSAYRAELPEAVAADLDPLEAFLIREQQVAQARLVAALDSERFGGLMEDWSAFLARDLPEAGDAEAAPDAGRPIVDVAGARIAEAYRRVRKRGKAAEDGAPPEALHRLRIACKRLRYAMEFFESLYRSGEIAPPIKALRKLQDNLGRFNDLDVQHDSLIRFAEQMFDRRDGRAATFMAMGRLVEHLELEQARERGRFDRRWRRFDDAASRRGFKRLLRSPRRHDTAAAEPVDGTDAPSEGVAAPTEGAVLPVGAPAASDVGEPSEIGQALEGGARVAAEVQSDDPPAGGGEGGGVA